MWTILYLCNNTSDGQETSITNAMSINFSLFSLLSRATCDIKSWNQRQVPRRYLPLLSYCQPLGWLGVRLLSKNRGRGQRIDPMHPPVLSVGSIPSSVAVSHSLGKNCHTGFIHKRQKKNTKLLTWAQSPSNLENIKPSKRQTEKKE